MKKTTLLCILDGWGHRIETEFNAIASANTPNWDKISAKYPKNLLNTSGKFVGLPDGQMGNSEVGHMNIGCGRIMLQLLPKINQAISENNIIQKEEFQDFVTKIHKSGGVCHLLGLLSDGGVHGHIDHLIYLAKQLARLNIKVKIHGFLDGRDVAQKSALKFLDYLQKQIKEQNNIEIATLAGRYFGMDRDNNWDRIAKNYTAISQAEGIKVTDFKEKIESYYQEGITDEFIPPLIAENYQAIAAGDGLFITNFRADRARQIIRSFLANEFDGFARKQHQFAAILGMAEYANDIDQYLPILFPSKIPQNTLADIISAQGLRQLHIAETEKYAHVTFFFNGGVEEPKAREERILIASPNVKTYDLQPEMSAPKVTAQLIEALKSGKYDFIVVNFANPDMVGHSGVWQAAISAVEQIDESLGKLEREIIAIGGNMLITADHGNIEYMFDKNTNQPHTAHTLNPVPLILVSPLNFNLNSGSLCDIAPTILELMSIKKPKEMTGKSLLEKNV